MPTAETAEFKEPFADRHTKVGRTFPDIVFQLVQLRGACSGHN